ncbi:type IV secretory system conjugative DNA transfer family protein [Dyella sp. A6]|uniref:type IV secretory system conjugative DNA transfer family protein n=1 Tax=Dyella aluminiiresistens TaxID=3069105 RepID=UPI002E764517|nr:type IV secretory system conjugative DNA transfer family protein [Dyella sp. A6]
MSHRKVTLAGVLLIITVAGGLYLAGWLTHILLRVSAPLAWNTWWQYLRASDLPQLAPYARRIRVAGSLGLGIPLLVWLGLLIPLFRSRQPSLHGDAGFARLSDLKKAGLLRQTPQGIVIGKYRGRYLWLNGSLHLIVISPTRSGKTTSIAIPILLSYTQSVVVLDLKGELRKLTSGWRQSQGQSIVVWAPYSEPGTTHRFNPFTLLAGHDPARRIGEIQTIAAILYPDEADKDPFWRTQARAAFTAFASFMFEAWDQSWRMGLPSDPNTVPDYPSFERILRISAGAPEQDTADMLGSILGDTSQYGYLSPQTRTLFSNLAGLAEQTFSSVIASMQAPLQQFLNPILAAATNATDFDILAIRKRPTTLYIDIPTNKLDESSKLLNIFFSSVIGNNLDKPLGDEPDLKYQMLMLMDEFTAMGRLEVWAKRISISASYGVRDCCIIQSQAQLRGTYGEHDAQNFITNHAAQVAFAPREQSDANAYSEMLGYRTLRRKQRSRSHGGGSHQTSTSYSEERRALLLPQEIKELPGDEELIFVEGCKPIRARKNWFFKDKLFKQRSALPPVTPRPQVHPPRKNDLADQANEAEAIKALNERIERWLQ